MTDAEKDAAWRLLPEDAKDKARKEFRRHKGCNSSTGNDYCCGYIGALIDFFGKHNLTASKEEPRFKVGDKVVTTANQPLYGAGWPGVIEKIDGIYADVRMFTENEIVFKADIGHLIPYAKKQEPKEDDDYEHGLMAVLNGENESRLKASTPLKTGIIYIPDNPDWLAYRMELAKEICPKIISALSDNGVSSVFCQSVIDKVATIVDGIVERLKGGDK